MHDRATSTLRMSRAANPLRLPGFAWGRTVCYLAMVLCSSLLSASHASAEDQILFVHLKWSTNGIQVLRTDVRLGKLKGRPPSEGRLQIRLADAQGQATWTGLIDDPRRRSYEYPKADSDDQLAQFEVDQEEAELVVRIPFTSGAQEIQVWGETIAPDPKVVQTGAARLVQPTRPLLLRHTLVLSPPTR